MNIKLTEQENKVVNFLVSRNSGKVYWEELAQFSKDPQTVKIKTVKKTLSEIKRKYALINEPLPFNISFGELSSIPTTKDSSDTLSVYDISPEEVLNAVPKPLETQVLVLLKRTSTPSVTEITSLNNKAVHPCHVDFVLNKNSRRVHTKDGAFNLNDNEWNVFAYLHERVGSLVFLSELRDKVVYQHFGSKLPARWFDSIKKIVNNIRHQIPGLRSRLLTIPTPGGETKFLFQ